MSQLHPVFNVVKLLRAPEDPIPGQKARLPPPPEMVDGEEHYVVEQVLDSRLMRGQLQFLIKWEGYGYEENSWIPESDICSCPRQDPRVLQCAPWCSTADFLGGFPLPCLPHFEDAAR